ncbi:MAG TPA: endolytic transglycosylase MltG [Candidatus Eisenbergiella merdipullorum]|uniref:Endolytic transglycosylase MltG n=1 Tax=Candidatus Eisenbergiella merdipullorum TaxID=2838553 RepID=A0A9D2L1F8_9FIRM|nr:endolytic transglycosylase MltG [Candidatus Eisenbergiella merdipullorum]
MSSRNRRRSGKKKEAAGTAVYTVVKIVVMVLIVMVVYRFGNMAYTYGERLFGEPAMSDAPGEDVVVTIEGSDSVRDVADKLEEAGLIRDAQLFVIQEKLEGFKSGLQPGTYTLNTSETPEEMIEILSGASAEDD